MIAESPALTFHIVTNGGADGRHGYRPVIAPSLSDDETSHETYHHHDERLLRRVFYVV